MEKVDMDKANKHYERILIKKVFHAWHNSNVSWKMPGYLHGRYYCINHVVATTRSKQAYH